MGSIAAILSYAHPPETSAVERGLRAAPHRGSKIRTHAVSRFAVGASATDEWPDTTIAEADGLVAAVRGSIDNLTELIADLRRQGIESGTSSAELVLALFRRYADSTPEVLRGAFAVIVSDGSRLWCFRDHLGFGTLFYRAEREAIYVATEAKQVVAAAGIPWQPDQDVATAIFHRENDDETPCAVRGVSRLPKMTVLSAASGTVRRRRYWHPERLLERARYSQGELKERFDELMTQAVARTLTGRGDVVSLSGGIDSPAIAAYGAPEHLRRTGKPLAAITTTYPHLPAVDELEYVEEVVRQLGLSLHVVRQDAPLVEGVDEWVRVLDGPVPQIMIGDAREHYELARELGFLTLLSGEIAEGLTAQRDHLVPYLLGHGRFRAALAQMKRMRTKGIGRGSLARQAAGAFVPLSVERAYRRLHPRDDPSIPDWLDTPPLDEMPNYEPARIPLRNRWRVYQLAGFKGPGLSVEADDIVQELCGVRVRRPWADVDLWEFFLSLRAETKFPDERQKAMVRNLLRGRVPDAIVDRKGKTLFNDSMMDRIDYPALRRWLVDTPVRVEGVDYELLEKRLADEDFKMRDLMWARDLAAIHAFVSQG